MEISLVHPFDPNRCPQCQGKGYWELWIMSSRDRHHCMLCDGTGRNDVAVERVLMGKAVPTNPYDFWGGSDDTETI